MNFPLIACTIAGVIITATLLWAKDGLKYFLTTSTRIAFGVQLGVGIIGTFFFAQPAVRYTIFTAAVVALGLAIANNKKP